MAPLPDFLYETVDASGVETFQPWVGQRRAEALAWASCLLIGVFLGFLNMRGEPLPCMGLGLFALFLAGAMLVSFSNWIDRHTRIRIDADQVEFRSPLRKVAIAWESLESLTAVRAASGWRILVAGAEEYFQFRTESILGQGTRAAMAVGIQGGVRLARLICSKAGLGQPTFEKSGWVSRRENESHAEKPPGKPI